MAEPIEITGTFLSERFRFENDGADDVVVANVLLVEPREDEDGRKTIPIKGSVDSDDPFIRHLQYRFRGRWTTYEKTGEKQFAFTSYSRCTPHGRTGVVAYLATAPGIGKKFASVLWQKFEADAVKTLREAPLEAATAIPRLSAVAAVEASDWLKQEVDREACMIDLITLLDGRGFPKGIYKKLIRKWGAKAATMVRANPLNLWKFKGVGFAKADGLYLALGGNPAALKRQALCIWHAINTNNNGDTWFFSGYARKALDAAIAGADVKFEKALKIAARGRRIDRIWTEGVDGPPSFDGDTLWLADHDDARHERAFAADVAHILRNTDRIGWPPVESDELTDHQKLQLSLATSGGRLGILTGGPGTGKSFTSAQLIKACADKYGYDAISVCALAGKATVRITEIMSSYDIPIQARTIHSTLGVQASDGENGWEFVFNRDNPLPCRLLLVDEFSMVDLWLASKLFEAIPDDCLVLIVGDANQLLPVGGGAPLRDLIEAGVPIGWLTEIHRNAGGVVKACKAISEGRPFEWEGNFIHEEETTPDRQLARIFEVLQQEQAECEEFHPVWDAQVIVPVNEKSPLARNAVNLLMQKALNPNFQEGSKQRFFVGDKVICLKNGQYTNLEPTGPQDKRHYVSNGDQGRVVRIDSKSMDVKLLAPYRFVRVPLVKGEDEDAAGIRWDLAYAISCHKGQGSEWDIVLVMLDEFGGAARLCDRAWFFTAISRMKVRCRTIGKAKLAHRMVEKDNIGVRKTFLKELLQGLMR